MRCFCSLNCGGRASKSPFLLNLEDTGRASKDRRRFSAIDEGQRSSLMLGVEANKMLRRAVDVSKRLTIDAAFFFRL